VIKKAKGTIKNFFSLLQLGPGSALDQLLTISHSDHNTFSGKFGLERNGCELGGGALACRGRICTMLISAVPGAVLWPAAMTVWGPAYASSGHAHHCVQLVLALDGNLRVRGQGAAWVSCGAVLVRPDAHHEVEARDTTVLIAFVEPESDLGAALAERLKQDVTPISRREVARWRAALRGGAQLSRSRVETWVRRDLLHGRKAPRIHPGVRSALRSLREQLGSPKVVSLTNLAKIAGLSRSRFMHVFTQSIGVPVRPYILWLRLQRASGLLMRGASITEAAHSAGFSDAAHLTRTCRRMLGTTPGELVRRRDARGEAFVPSE
jgi:AraC-like DNA-binding protein